MTTSKRRLKRRVKRGGQNTPDIETGPTHHDISHYNVPADPLRDKKYDELLLKESFRRRPTAEVEDIFAKPPHEEQELANMRNEEMDQIVGEYEMPMDSWSKGGRKCHKSKKRKSKSKNRKTKSKKKKSFRR